MDQILVVEDRATTLEWLVSAVQMAFPDATVHTATNVAEGNAFLDQQIDLALIDLELPDGSGISLIKALKAGQPASLPVVATMFDDDEHLFSALSAGAMGYVLKDHSREDLAELLKGIVNGRPPLSPAIAQRLLDRFRANETRSPEELTNRETEVLLMIAKGYKLQKVADSLSVSRNTIAYHVKNIYQKLHISSRAEAVNEAVRMGLISHQ